MVAGINKKKEYLIKMWFEIFHFDKETGISIGLIVSHIYYYKYVVLLLSGPYFYVAGRHCIFPCCLDAY